MSAITAATIGTIAAAGASAGAGIYSAHKASSANKDAARIADTFSRQALDYEKERDTYERQRQAELDRRSAAQDQWAQAFKEKSYAGLESRMAPYVQAGGNSADRQAQLLGLPARQSPTMPGQVNVAPQQPVGGVPGGMPANGAMRPAVQPIRAQEQVMLGGAQAQPTGAEAAGEPMVNMMAPDGSTRPVPASQVQHYLAKGAKQV
jgi:hypothetical protein